MAKLIYSMIISLDGYAEAAEGGLGTGAEDPEVHTFINDLSRPVGTYLYGRRMYETMAYWETAHTDPDLPPHILSMRATGRRRRRSCTRRRWSRSRAGRRGSSGLSMPRRCARSRRSPIDDITVDGPNLAAQAIAAGLVDEYQLFITTSVVGGGKRFFPDGVRLDLDLIEERAFGSGLIYASYRLAEPDRLCAPRHRSGPLRYRA